MSAALQALFGHRLRFVNTPPGPKSSIPDGIVENSIKMVDAEDWFPQALLVRLDSPLKGPKIGIDPWVTQQVIITPRRTAPFSVPAFPSDTLVNSSVYVIRAADAKNTAKGRLEVGDVIPYATARIVRPDAGSPGMIDESFYMEKEKPSAPSMEGGIHEEIPEFLFDPTEITKVKLPRETTVIAAKYGTPIERIEKQTGKKMKIYGASTDLKKGLLFISEEDDRRILMEHARKSIWDDYHELAKMFSLAVNEGYFPEAEQLVKRTLEIKPGNLMALSLLASVEASMDKFDDAERIAGEVLSVHPDDDLACFQLAKIRALQGNIPESIRLFREVTWRNPGYTNAVSALYMAYAEMKKPADGRWCMQALAANDPLSPAPVAVLSAVFEEDKDPSAALEFARAACERFPVDITVGGFAGCLGAAGRVDDAIAVIEHFWAQDKVGEGSLKNLVYAYEQVERIEEANNLLAEIERRLPEWRAPEFIEWKERLESKLAKKGRSRSVLKGLLRRRD